MTLEEFNQVVTDASQKAHLFVGDITRPKRVRSVALRMDDDGVLSIVLYPDRMTDRILTAEAKELHSALSALRELEKREPGLKGSFDEFDGYFVHWDEVLEAISAAGDGYSDYAESPLELIARMINERDDLLVRLAASGLTDEASEED